MKFLVKGSCEPAAFERTLKKPFISHYPLNIVNNPYFRGSPFEVHFLLFHL